MMSLTNPPGSDGPDNTAGTRSPLGGTHVPLGIVYTRAPIPLVPESTKWIDAGAVAFGLESRLLNEDVITGVFGDDEEEMARIRDELAETGLPDDAGLSIHVVESATRMEYLRFDMFPDDPHYHYIPGPNYQVIVPYDVAASGDMLEWTLSVIGGRLEKMLRTADASALAESIEPDALGAAVNEIRKFTGSLAFAIAGRG
jgi:hypothetical protein